MCRGTETTTKFNSLLQNPASNKLLPMQRGTAKITFYPLRALKEPERLFQPPFNASGSINAMGLIVNVYLCDYRQKSAVKPRLL